MAKKVISATVTPLNADGSLDRNGLKNIFERNVRHGIDGVFLSDQWANGAVSPILSKKRA